MSSRWFDQGNMFGDESTHLGSEPLSLVSDLMSSALDCVAVTLRLLCCRRPHRSARRSSSMDIAEYHAPTAAPAAQSVSGSSPERSSHSGTAAPGARPPEDQPLLKPGHGSSGRLSRQGHEAQQGQEMQGMGAVKQKEGLELALEDEDCCPTCLETFSPEDPAIETHCQHRFHLQCILMWYERRQTCPVCDREMDFDEIEAALA